jgi:ABC-type nitrate/sulfonate/bicarbonate transport system substrate-binding protein
MRGITRRRFLQGSGTAAALALGGAAAALAACGSDDDGDEDTRGRDLGTLAVQLAWTKTVQYAGLYIADSEGYYADAGYSSVALTPGPGDAMAPLLSGAVLFSFAASEVVANAVLNEGAPLRVIGANYQRNPFCVLYLAEDPIPDPAALEGKTIGVQPANEQVWALFLRANGLAEGEGPDRVRRVPVGYEPTPLEDGEVDGYLAFISNEPNTLRAQGIDHGTLDFDDYGIVLYQYLYTVTEESLDARRDELVAALRAESKGWQHAKDDEDLAVDLTVDTYGKDLDLDREQQARELSSQFTLQTSTVTEDKGLFYMGEQDVAANVRLLSDLDLPVSADLYTNDVLDEVYAGGIDLYPG